MNPFPITRCRLPLAGMGLVLAAMHGLASAQPPLPDAPAREATTLAQIPAPDITPLPPIFEPSDERRSIGGMIDDGVLTREVGRALARDEQLSGERIDVDTRDGVVTLQGGVATHAQRRRAIEHAESVEGVTAVNSDALVVR